MTRVLVLYYSRNGSTDALARQATDRFVDLGTGNAGLFGHLVGGGRLAAQQRRIGSSLVAAKAQVLQEVQCAIHAAHYSLPR